MTTEQIVLAAVLAGYLVVMFALSIYAARKVHDEEDYLVAGRKLPLLLAWGTLLATWFGADSMTGVVDAVREEGIRGAVLDPFACSLTLILAGVFFARPLWEMKLLTMGDFFRQKYGARSEILSCCIQVPSYFGWIAAQFVALGAVLHDYFGMPLAQGILIAAAVTLTYTMIGGMWSVTLTDTLQLVIMIVGLIIIADASIGRFGGGSLLEGVNRLLAETPAERRSLWPEAGTFAALSWAGAWASGLFGNLPGQDLQQRVFSANSPRTAQLACILSGLVYLAMGLVPIGLGLLSALEHPGEIEASALTLLAQKNFSPSMQMVFTLAFVSIVLSTATSAVLAPASMLGHNLLGRLRAFDGHHVLVDRVSVAAVTLGGLALSFSGDSIMELLGVSLAIALVGLFVPLAAGIYGRPRGELPALLSMSFGFGSWLVRYVFEQVLVNMAVFFAAAEAADDFPAFIAQEFSPERVGSAQAAIVYAFALVPPEILGLALSLAGYFLGQWILKRRERRATNV